MDYDKLLTAKDELILRIVLILILVFSPYGVFYLAFGEKFITSSILEKIVLIIISASPIILFSYAYYFSVIKTYTSLSLKLKEILKSLQNDAKRFAKECTKIKTHLNSPSDKTNKLIMKDASEDINELSSLVRVNISGIKKSEADLKLKERYFIIEASVGAIGNFYLISSPLLYCQFFLLTLPLKTFILIEYSLFMVVLFVEYLFYRIKIKLLLIESNLNKTESERVLKRYSEYSKYLLEKERLKREKNTKELKKIQQKYILTYNKLKKIPLKNKMLRFLFYRRL
jgi:hypothetical protein